MRFQLAPSRLHRDERGQAVAFFVGIIFVLFGFMAFAIDIGFFFHARRIAQNAADPAALAGAAVLEGCGVGDPLLVANEYAEKNLLGKAFTVGDTLGPMAIVPYDIDGIPFDSVYARVTRTQRYLFAGFLGLAPVNIPAEAQAVCAPASGGGVCPFAVVAPHPDWDPVSHPDEPYGIKLGMVYVIKTSAQDQTTGNFSILQLIEGSAKTAYWDFLASGCEDPDAESAVIVDVADILTDTIPGDKSGPTSKAMETLYTPEHTLFPTRHAACNVSFRLDEAGPDLVVGTADDYLSGTVLDGVTPVYGQVAIDLVDVRTANTACDAIESDGSVVDALMHVSVQGRFIQIVLIADFPNGASDPALVLGILRMYVACWDNQDGVAGGCGTGVPPGQVAIYGIFGEYKAPNLLKTVGVGNNPLAPKHVVLVR